MNPIEYGEESDQIIQLRRFLTDSDVDAIKDYVANGRISLRDLRSQLARLRSEIKFTDELVNYLLELNNHRTKNILAGIFIQNDDIENFKLVLSRIYDIEYYFMDIIGSYSSHTEDTDWTLQLKRLFLLSLEYFENNITLVNIYNIKEDSGMNRIEYIANDLILYMTFRIINDHMLSSTPTGIIEYLAKIAVANSVNVILTDTLLKYVPENRVNVILNTNKLSRPNDYISFFDEDI